MRGRGSGETRQADLVGMGMLSAQGVALAARDIADLIEQLFGSLCHASLRKSGVAEAAELMIQC